MALNQNDGILQWCLESGSWLQDAKYDYLLEQLADLKNNYPNAPYLAKQLLGATIAGEKIYPPEFKYHPESGEKLETAILKTSAVWLAPFGQCIDQEQQSQRPHHGLQLSQQLRKLKHAPQHMSDAAEVEIRCERLKGYFEFLSICCGTAQTQLIAVSKNKRELFILNEYDQSWLSLRPQSAILAECPQALQSYWQMLVFYHAESTQHQLYLPTTQGLACLTIDAKTLRYQVEYVTPKGPCLGVPVYWHGRLLQLVYIQDQLHIYDVFKQEILNVELKPLTELYFEKVVYDANKLIWIGNAGQLILSYEVDQSLSARYLPWLPLTQPDFRFGAPFLDRLGHFYQLCLKQDQLCYIQLDAQKNAQISNFRFTTGQVVYNFENKLEGNIWEEAKNSVDQQKILVPLIEDPERSLVLGFRFESAANESIDQKLENTHEQDIVLFLDSHEKMYLFHRVSVRNPLESRYFYHGNYLYFYNPSLGRLLAWETE